MRPLRSKTTYTERLEDEVCVYEWTRHEVHALNATAATVWELCDGTITNADMAERLEARGLSDAEQLVALALDEFQRKHLLEPDAVLLGAHAPIGRRALLRRGVTAALLPVVTSIVAPTPLQAQSPGARSRTFSFTGASETFVVPSGVTALTVSAFGAAGEMARHDVVGQPSFVAAGGLGGSVTATLAVTPGETLVITVGGTPPAPTAAGTRPPGFNGGGQGWTEHFFLANSGSGGGATDIRRGGAGLANRVLVAGGGGGAGATSGASGGAGGGTTGGNGNPQYLGSSTVPPFGGGGSQTAGGAGGDIVFDPPIFLGLPGTPGNLGVGGNGGVIIFEGGPVVSAGAGGGGGGGYFGGGGGAINRGGGGGSSYADPAATGVVHVQGTRAGDGLVILTW